MQRMDHEHRRLPAELDRRRGDGHAGPARACASTSPAPSSSACCKPYVAGVLEGAPWFDELILLDQRRPVVAALAGASPGSCAASGVDLAVLFPNSFRSALVAWLGGCRRRVGFARYGRGLLLTDRLRAGPRRARPAACPARSSTPTTGSPSAPAVPGPATAWSCSPRRATRRPPTRVWQQARPATRYREVDLPQSRRGVRRGEALAGRVLRRAWPGRWPISAAAACWCCAARPSATWPGRSPAWPAGPACTRSPTQPLSLGLTKACVRRADLLVTTDSGPRHFAAAFDRPVVTLFGPTHIAWTETYYAAGGPPAEAGAVRPVPAARLPARPPLHERAEPRPRCSPPPTTCWHASMLPGTSERRRDGPALHQSALSRPAACGSAW